MPCCGGKKSARPVSRAQYLVGSTLLFGYHLVWGAALEACALANHRFGPVAAFHRRYVRDLWSVVRRRDGIVMEGEPVDESCARDDA